MKALTLGLLLLAGVASAGTLKGNEENCRHFGNVIIQIAVQRDQGLPWDAVEQWVNESIADALGKPGSIVQDADDVAYVKSVVRDLYGKDRELPAPRAGLGAFLDCMGKKPV